MAPFGAVSPVFTPNPIAAGIPTSGDPILLDISARYTTNGLTQPAAQGRREAAARVGAGRAAATPTDDPAVLFDEPKGTLLPLGGLDAGHKGFALALLIEALTAGLTGFGRADPSEGWGATVFVQVLDPQAFGGRDAFLRQTQWLADACHAATPRPGGRARAPARRARPGADAVASRGRRSPASVDPARARTVGRASSACRCPWPGLMHVMAGRSSLRHAFRQ